MKLLVHNMLSSKFLKGVQKGYPLKIVANKTEITEQEFNPDFVKRMIPKLDWEAFKTTADSLGQGSDLPTALPEGQGEWESNEDFLKCVHKLLLEVEIQEGFLECPETGRQFPIKNGIPNMLANDDEVA